MSKERSAKLLRDGFVLWSKKHQMWWRPQSMGYCNHLAQAGVYTEAEAIDLVSRSQCDPNKDHHTVMHRVRDLNLYGSGVEPLREDSLMHHLTIVGGIPE